MNEVNLALTAAGQALMAKIQAGDGSVPLELTRVVAGSGASGDPLGQTAVIGEEQTFSVTEKKTAGPRAEIRCVLSNAGLAAGYALRQIGFYAMDPDLGEILYRISQHENPNYVPAERERPWTYEPSFNFVVGNASEVAVTVDPAGLVTRRQLDGELAGYVPLSGGQGMATGMGMGSYAQKDLGYVYFPGGVADQNIDVIVAEPPNFGAGWLEIDVASGYHGANASGGLTKRIHYAVSDAAPQNLVANCGAYTSASPHAADHFAISDLWMDGNLLKATIHHLTSAGNPANVFFRQMNDGYNPAFDMGFVSLGGIYASAPHAPPPRAVDQHYDSGWQDLVLQNGATPAINPAQQPQYRKIGNTVRLRGRVSPNSAGDATIATLPAGFRPMGRAGFVVGASTGETADKMRGLEIMPGGQVLMARTGMEGAFGLYIDCSFIAEQ